MKRFVFRLDRLLHLRTTAERERGRALVEAMREEEAQRQAWRESAERLAQATAQLGRIQRDLSTAGNLRNLELSVNACTAVVRESETAHLAAMTNVEAEIRSFEEARMARRAIERLREQRRLTWGESVSRHEQQETDETALRMTRLTREQA